MSFLSRQIRLFARGKSPLSSLSRLSGLLETLVEEWYSDVDYEVFAEGKGSNHWISIHECEAEAAKGRTFVRFPDGSDVQLSRILFGSMLLDRSEIPFEEIAVNKEIGKGAFGSVFHGIWRGQEIALKTINFSESVGIFKEFIHELSIMCGLLHPSIVQFHGYSKWMDGDAMKYFILMELCSRDLCSFLDDPYGLKKSVLNVQKITGFIQTVLSTPQFRPELLLDLQMTSGKLYDIMLTAEETAAGDSQSFVDRLLMETLSLLFESIQNVRLDLESPLNSAMKWMTEQPTEVEMESLTKSAERVREASVCAVHQKTKCAYDELSHAIASFLSFVRAIVKPLTLSFRSRVSHQIACGVAYLHHLVPAILHGDLKTQNVLLTSQYDAKLTDFGLSCHADQAGGHSLKDEIAPVWAAPETMSSGVLTTASDAYGFALIMWELMERSPPFQSLEYQSDLGQRRLRDDVIAGYRPLIPEKEYNDDEAAYIQLIRNCWAAEPRERPRFLDIVERLYLLNDSLGVVCEKVTFSRTIESSLSSRSLGDIRGEFIQFISTSHQAEKSAPASQYDAIVGTVFIFKLFYLLSISLGAPLRLSSLLDGGNYVVGIGAYPAQHDFGFTIYSADSGAIQAEIHFAHEFSSSELEEASYPISSQVLINEMLYSFADDGVRKWSLEMISNEKIPDKSLPISYPDGLKCVLHSELTKSSNIWCSGVDSSLSLWCFNANTSAWKDSIRLSELQSKAVDGVSCLVYSPDCDVIWAAAAHCIARIQLFNLEVTAHMICTEESGVDLASHISHMIYLPHSQQLLVVTGNSFGLLSPLDMTPTLSLSRFLSIPNDLSPISSVLNGNQRYFLSGHHDGGIVQWSWMEQMKSVTHQLFPGKHKHHVVSMVGMWEMCVWSGCSGGMICVWK